MSFEPLTRVIMHFLCVTHGLLLRLQKEKTIVNTTLHWRALFSQPETPEVEIVQSLSCVWLLVTLRTAEHQAPLCFTISHSWLKFMPIGSGGCYQVISSSATPFSFCSQSFPASQSFPVSQLLASGGWRIGASASALVLPMYIQGQGNWKWGHRTLGIEISGLSSTHLNRNPHFFFLSHTKLSGMWWEGA